MLGAGIVNMHINEMVENRLAVTCTAKMALPYMKTMIIVIGGKEMKMRTIEEIEADIGLCKKCAEKQLTDNGCKFKPTMRIYKCEQHK